jgi:hypothetical protein
MSVVRGERGETHHGRRKGRKREVRFTMIVTRGEIEERLTMSVAIGDRGETHHERSKRR